MRSGARITTQTGRERHAQPLQEQAAPTNATGIFRHCLLDALVESSVKKADQAG